jgi:hypothetical protein
MGSTWDLQKHVATAHETCLFKCTEAGCDKTFEQEKSLKRHLEAKHGDESKKINCCPHCTFRCRLPTDLKWHIKRTHPDGNEFDCPIQGCGLRFTEWGTRKKHIREVHKSVVPAPFNCRVCGKEFRTKSQMAKHEMYHGNLRPFMCDICSATFKSRANLQTHGKVHEKESDTRKKCQPRKQRLSPIGGMEVQEEESLEFAHGFF